MNSSSLDGVKRELWVWTFPKELEELRDSHNPANLPMNDTKCLCGVCNFVVNEDVIKLSVHSAKSGYIENVPNSPNKGQK